MTKIPNKLKKELEADPFYKICALKESLRHTCEGRITWEHAIIYSNKQLQQRWAIVPICAKAHAVDGFQDAGTMNKELNIWVALNRASDTELTSISKAINYHRERHRLNQKYGSWIQPKINQLDNINY